MGSTSSSFLTNEEVDMYAELTYLKKREVIRASSLFRHMDPTSVDTDRRIRLPSQLIRERVPELQCNPFGERILEMFSSEGDDCLSFEDFLDMLSVFSRSAPDELKSSYAFRLYDFDGDSVLDRSDLSYVLDRLTRTQTSSMASSEKAAVIDKILEESDIDRNGTISAQEFQHVVTRCPEFAQAFSFEII
ncbi:calcium and integrin-binding protein 1-like [Pollicipes pollicipes]|uniref:calcium and integrin-binding protein 1-like n=1 Tax=Pollicipes pollicipes TaxID=41117 RepID=UPI0018859236|nr:calcium and integrin-binding protein 1-like [Pollicipes pollicipes]